MELPARYECDVELRDLFGQYGSVELILLGTC